jgi:thioredoxin reductase
MSTQEYEMTTHHTELPVVVMGAGPVGLAAAAHLAERDIDFVLLEAGDTVAASIAQWGHVRLFSPWRYNTDSAARRLLAATGWTEPDPDALPTGNDLIDGYLAPLATLPSIVDKLRLDTAVVGVTRVGVDRVRTAGREAAPFLVRVTTGDGRLYDVRARAVIDASGTWTIPNVLGANGLPAYGEADDADRIIAALPDVLGKDRHRFAGRHTVVVGAGHSATTTLLELATLAETEPETRVTWALRAPSPDRAYGGGEADALPARGSIGSRVRALVETGAIAVVNGFHTHTLRASSGGGVELVSQAGTEQTIAADVVVNATGFRPDHTITAELRLDLDPILGSTRALAPLIDPNEHSCGTVPPHGVDELSHPEPGYYAVGVKSYGRAPTFLLATGYEQVRSVVAAIDGDWTAARDVQLELPETGVCSSNLPGELAGDSCCGTTASVSVATPVGRGPATGVVGGVIRLPLVEQTSGGRCCG